jgi:hypothetical protein
MADQSLVTVMPPAGSAPNLLQLPDATCTRANDDGTFTVPSTQVVALLSSGWQIVVAPGTTHVP